VLLKRELGGGPVSRALLLDEALANLRLPKYSGTSCLCFANRHSQENLAVAYILVSLTPATVECSLQIKVRTMTRVLFVDDEPGIRETLPMILRQYEYSVDVAATVPEALAKISAESFDVLITDLNIGSPGDGFTVVSAMRRTHPMCVTFILTGYPGLDTALEAIRSQVDDYLIKPANPKRLIETIEGKLRAPRSHPEILTKRLSTVLRENNESIKQRVLAYMKTDPEISVLPLGDEERVSVISEIIMQLAEVLDSPDLDGTESEYVLAAHRRGELRLKQGYPASLLLANLRMLESAIYETVNENLLALNLSFLIMDLKKLNESLHRQMETTLRAYVANSPKAA
jgi:DNA-binding response OmpR family regulator